ncbi:MAG TPA: phage protein Gp37 [Aliidongia sp.]|uniref:phage protein Gp37 n=1 Tax=Aliidongia sp. TaxID=1914230 RepID=UPI002DDDA762|nr:phage protein Gp37 [Aliidongia sp.]HEV2675274.1 phage protein Gp37 [Aliidongia sp.]
MTDPITQVEDAMVAAVHLALGSKLRKVETVPGGLSAEEWGARLRVSPAVYIGFLGGPAEPPNQTRIMGRFMAYVVTGNSGSDEKTRRRGTPTTIGAYPILAVLIPTLGELRVQGIGDLVFTGEVSNLFSTAFDDLGISVYAAEFKVGISFSTVPDLSQYADFTTFDADIVTQRPLPTDPIPLPDGEAALESRVTLPNS